MTEPLPPSCIGKVPYASKRKALEAIAVRKRWRDGPPVTYRCPCCKQWHLAHGRSIGSSKLGGRAP